MKLHLLSAALLAASVSPAAAQVITPAPKAAPSAAPSITEAQTASLNAEAKQNTGKSCNLSAKKMFWSQKALALTASTAASGGLVGDVIPMPAPTASAPSAQLQVAEQFLAALEKLTGDYSTVVKLGHSASGKWALVRDRDNLTPVYFAVSQGNGQMAVKFCELQ